MAKADELVRHFGLAKTTVADIAAALGMSPANIYKSFPSKDAIIEAVAEQTLADLKRTIEAAIASSPGALARADLSRIAGEVTGSTTSPAVRERGFVLADL